MSTRKHVWLTAETHADLGDGPLSTRIAVVADRHAELCRRARITRLFTTPELDAIRDATRSWLPEPAATIFGGVALELEDAADDGLGEKWGIDLPALLAKVRALGLAEQVALVDWIERQRTTP
jgi:hypothetical protein